MTFILHLQRLVIVPPPAAYVAGDVDIRQKIHLDAPKPVTLAGFAAPAFHVEAEAPRFVAALARFRQHGVQIADGREQPRISSGIGARSAANGRLVDANHLVQLAHAFDLRKLARQIVRPVDLLGQRAIQNLVHQRGFAAARNSRDHGQQPQRKFHVDVFQIVLGRADDRYRLSVGRRGAQAARGSASRPKDSGPSAMPGWLQCRFGVPAATSSPPSRPAPGPRSIT